MPRWLPCSLKQARLHHPTGTGKSFIGFKLCEDNPDKSILWLSSSEYIFKTQLEKLAAVSDGYQPNNITFMTYAKLTNLTDADMAMLTSDFFVIDEFHRGGSEVWGGALVKLLSMHKGVPMLGLTATAVRYLDNQRNMAKELFNDCIALEMTLGEAIYAASFSRRNMCCPQAGIRCMRLRRSTII